MTEYAGSSSVMKNVLDAPGRFGTQAELAAQPTDVAFVSYMLQHQFPLTSQTVAVLQKYIPVPAALAQNQGITAPQFYQNLSYYLGSLPRAEPGRTSSAGPRTSSRRRWRRTSRIAW